MFAFESQYCKTMMEKVERAHLSKAKSAATYIYLASISPHGFESRATLPLNHAKEDVDHDRQQKHHGVANSRVC